MNIPLVLQTLELLWKGMLGIFTVLIVIAVIVWLLSLADKRAAKRKVNKND